MDARVDLPRASQLPVRPQFHPRGIFGFLPLPPAGPCLRASEREAPHLSILSLSHSFLVKNEADAYPLAGDNVRINDKICKARSAAFGRGKKKKKYRGCVIFPKSGFLRVISFFPVREAVLIPGDERSLS